jgi:hypothetical protein
MLQWGQGLSVGAVSPGGRGKAAFALSCRVPLLTIYTRQQARQMFLSQEAGKRSQTTSRAKAICTLTPAFLSLFFSISLFLLEWSATSRVYKTPVLRAF